MIGPLPPLPLDWAAVLGPALASPEGERLAAFLAARRAAGAVVYPPADRCFLAFALTPLDTVRVVILGQDPYHGDGQAMGLAFSVPAGFRPPPSLVNIFKEREADLGLPRPAHGDLTAWARGGVLLLNTSLSVEAGRAGSHARQGWEAVTDAAIAAVAASAAPTVFVLWGAHAQGKAALIERAGGGRHLRIESAHPSPLSARRGFFGSRPFSRANAFLAAHGREGVDWRL